jgi:hypothetical protein
MKTYLAAAALAAALAQPAAAVTFPSLTTIYVGSGVNDNGAPDQLGTATSIHCSNVSGVAVQVRALILGSTGSAAGSLTQTLAHGATVTFSTHRTQVFLDETTSLTTGAVAQGVVNVEATNSAVFCTAHIVGAADNPPAFMGDLHLVRVNPHPGTVE